MSKDLIKCENWVKDLRCRGPLIFKEAIAPKGVGGPFAAARHSLRIRQSPVWREVDDDRVFAVSLAVDKSKVPASLTALS